MKLTFLVPLSKKSKQTHKSHPNSLPLQDYNKNLLFHLIVKKIYSLKLNQKRLNFNLKNLQLIKKCIKSNKSFFFNKIIKFLKIKLKIIISNKMKDLLVFV